MKKTGKIIDGEGFSKILDKCETILKDDKLSSPEKLDEIMNCLERINDFLNDKNWK